MKANGIDSCAGLIAYIQEIGILPLLPTGIRGWSADAVVDDDCRYTVLPDGGWEWPLWKCVVILFHNSLGTVNNINTFWQLLNVGSTGKKARSTK